MNRMDEKETASWDAKGMKPVKSLHGDFHYCCRPARQYAGLNPSLVFAVGAPPSLLILVETHLLTAGRARLCFGHWPLIGRR